MSLWMRLGIAWKICFYMVTSGEVCSVRGRASDGFLGFASYWNRKLEEESSPKESRVNGGIKLLVFWH
jgi:hypothetical protein